MKKILLVLGMITCILGLTACGSKAEDAVINAKISQEEAIVYADQLVEGMNSVVQQGAEAQYESDDVLTKAFESWKGAAEDMGSYQGILDHEVEIGEKSTVINVVVDGTIRDAKVEIILDKDLQLSSITTNVIYSFGESMEKAALNTVIGMGTVFIVLILISAIISAFIFIPKLQAAFSKKEKNVEEVKKEAVENTIAQIAESEELTDDLELVAVIAAAVAASEGMTSTDGFVVRSIRRANTNKWQRA